MPSQLVTLGLSEARPIMSNTSPRRSMTFTESFQGQRARFTPCFPQVTELLSVHYQLQSFSASCGGEFYSIVASRFVCRLRAPGSRCARSHCDPRLTHPWHRALANLMQQLSVLLWRYNASFAAQSTQSESTGPYGWCSWFGHGHVPLSLTWFSFPVLCFKGSVDRSRHERHFCSLLPYFLLSWLQIFQLCLSFWTSSFDLVLFKNSFRKKKNIQKTTQNALAPSIFIVLAIVLKLGTPLLHTQAQNTLLQNF